MIQASLQKTGVVTNPIKDGTGKATMETAGNYSTGIDNQYKIEIESLSTAGIGTAKFRWSRNDTVIASSVVTSTALITLENGVVVKWSSGLTSATDAFGSTLDKWRFEGKNLFGYNQVIDRKRNTRWRSSTDINIELHTDTAGGPGNAMTDPAGNEANTTGSWVASDTAIVFFANPATFTVGSYSFRYDGTTDSLSSISIGINNLSTIISAGYKLTYDFRSDILPPSSLLLGLRSRINGITLKQFLSTSISFESQEFNIISGASAVILSFQQPSTNRVAANIDNLSLKLLPGFVINLGFSRKVDAIIIQDHNLTSNANISLKARIDTAWEISTVTLEAVDETIAWADDKILHYVVSSSNQRRYWRLDISDTGNPDGYIEIGNLYLGSHDEMVRNAAIGYKQTETVIGSRNIDPYGVEDNRFRNRQKTWQYRLPASTDIETLEGIFDNIYSSTDGKYDPVWINPTSNSTDFHMVHLDSLPLAHRFSNKSDITLNFREVLKSN